VWATPYWPFAAQRARNLRSFALTDHQATRRPPSIQIAAKRARGLTGFRRKCCGFGLAQVRAFEFDSNENSASARDRGRAARVGKSAGGMQALALSLLAFGHTSKALSRSSLLVAHAARYTNWMPIACALRIARSCSWAIHNTEAPACLDLLSEL
jgi:hypothetical protein